MPRSAFGWLTAACLLLVSACSGLGLPPELDQAARTVFARFHSGDSDAILRDGAPLLIENDAASTIRQINSLLPMEEPEEVNFVGYSWSKTASEPASQHRLTYEIRWAKEAALMNVSFEQYGETPYQLNGFTFRIASREELAANEFNLSGKTLGHYAMMAAVFVSPLLMITAFVMALTTPGLPRRWLWCLLSVVTLCLFRLDWANGAFQFVLLHAGLVSFGFSRGGSLFSSWVLTAGIPVGAIYVMFRVWRHRRDEVDAGKPADPA